MSKTMREMKREWEEDELRYGEVAAIRKNRTAEKARSGKCDYFEYLEKQGMHDLADKLEEKAKSNNSADIDTPKPRPQDDPNNRQIDGTHYKKHAIQPWDFIHRNGIGYLEGCAIKYLVRWRDKGGIADLQKAQHYIEKLIEEEKSGTAD